MSVNESVTELSKEIVRLFLIVDSLAAEIQELKNELERLKNES